MLVTSWKVGVAIGVQLANHAASAASQIHSPVQHKHKPAMIFRLMQETQIEGIDPILPWKYLNSTYRISGKCEMPRHGLHEQELIAIHSTPSFENVSTNLTNLIASIVINEMKGALRRSA